MLEFCKFYIFGVFSEMGKHNTVNAQFNRYTHRDLFALRIQDYVMVPACIF